MKDLEPQFTAIINKHKGIEKKLSEQTILETSRLIELNKEYSELLPIVEAINAFNFSKKELSNLNDLLKDDDNSIREMAEEEIREKKISLKEMEND